MPHDERQGDADVGGRGTEDRTPAQFGADATVIAVEAIQPADGDQRDDRRDDPDDHDQPFDDRR